MQPSQKSLPIEEALANIFGFDRRDSISSHVCVPAPIGCGKPVNFTIMEEIELREYRISGLCATCQREIFTPREDEDDF